MDGRSAAAEFVASYPNEATATLYGKVTALWVGWADDHDAAWHAPSKEHAAAFVRWLADNYRASTVRTYRNVVAAFLTHLEAEEIEGARNTFRYLRGRATVTPQAHAPKPKVWLSPSQLNDWYLAGRKRTVTSGDPRWGCEAILLHRGLRSDEARSVRWVDLDTDSESPSVSVNGKSGTRSLSLTDEEADFLTDARDCFAAAYPLLLWVPASDKPVSARRLHHDVQAIAADAGYKSPAQISPHTIRRSAAEAMHRSRETPDTIRAALGHNSFNTTSAHYLQPISERDATAELAASTRASLMAAGPGIQKWNPTTRAADKTTSRLFDLA